MAYEVIARKWRPQKFADVVGQRQITKTLQSELLQNKLAHAYLFVGPRGIGKTTIARIFAKAMNCERAPIDEPCCECDSCKSIADGNCIDLIEIDGASNNSVDDMRTLCEEVLYSPVSSRYKVYIIDEVHMLSSQAWNALLKTIEEPPPHAKFLFATTEAHKVLATVVSRCQRFDLRRITFRLISEQLRKIATAENVSISDAAIEVIARAADGGMRDAQSLLDQMIAFSAADQGEISEEQALSVFGLTGVAEMERLLSAVLTDDRPAVIASIHKIASSGKNLEKLFDDILGFLRGIHICMLMPDPETILEIGDDMIATYRKVGAGSTPDLIHKMLEQLSPVGTMLHNALNKQVFLETILLKAMRVTHAVEIETLIARLNQIRAAGDLDILEKMPPAANSATPAAYSPVAPAQEQSTTTSSSPTHTNIQQPTPPAENASVEDPKLSQTPPKGDSNSQVAQAPVEQPSQPTLAERPPQYDTNKSAAATSVSALSSAPVPPTQPQPANAENTDKTIETPDSPSVPAPNAPNTTSPTPEPSVLLTNPLRKNDEPQEQGQSSSASNNKRPKLESPIAVWHALTIEMERCSQPLLKAYMKEGMPKSFENGTLTVAFDEEFEEVHVTALQKERALLETCLKRLTGNPKASLSLIRSTGVSSYRELPFVDDTVKEEIKRRAEKNPFVQGVLDLFDGRIVDVRG